MPSSADKIAHDARQLLPRIADRLHARLHHAFLKLGSDVRQPLQRHLEIGILVTADDFQKLVAGQNQFGHRGHQMIERLDVNADRMAGEPFAAFVLGFFGHGLSGLLPLALRRGARIVVPAQLRFRVGLAGELIELLDQIAVVALGLALVRFDRVEDELDPVDRGQNERNRARS